MESQRLLFCDTKTILGYMEPSFRFNIALKIPSIRRAEKAAPLYIKYLDLHDTRFVVNETEYSMRVFPKTGREVPGLPRGEVDYDFDEYGFKINLDESSQPGHKLLTDSIRLHLSRGSKVDELEYEYQEKNALPCNHYIRIPWRYLSNLFSIQTHKVSLTIRSPYFVVENLIDTWIEKRRPIGVCYSLPTNSKEDLARISHPEVLQRSTDCIKLKMGDEAVIVFRYTEANRKTYLTIETIPKTK
ncbi:Protein CBG00315 [Caenorhabditis briggsae]|uniref:Protein CBG00315 n=1 Tax=Caenorhabditis briggsae TaxID=6238 RepID=A8WMP4_CAEBR|nr:Protein CBG00315 [Caenorhabditis briggsae]CAP21749.1 Protein CBG00315 [Caenorhabditis briggsae]